MNEKGSSTSAFSTSDSRYPFERDLTSMHRTEGKSISLSKLAGVQAYVGYKVGQKSGHQKYFAFGKGSDEVMARASAAQGHLGELVMKCTDERAARLLVPPSYVTYSS